MQTILTKLSDEKAIKEVKQFSYWGLALSAVSLFIFWWLGIAGLALSSRGLLLTWHKANKGKADRYRLLAAIGILLGLTSIVWYSIAS